jgi:type IV secretion system protein VirB9
MIRSWLLGISFCAALSAPLGGYAAVTPAPLGKDPRLRVIQYDPSEIIILRGSLGYETTIEFGEDEHIDMVAIGDGLGWQVTPNRQANRLVLKPMELKAATDMTVNTNLRHYVFDLRVQPKPRPGDASPIFELRFIYPEPVLVTAEPKPKPPPPQQPKVVNDAYRFEGSSKGLPSRVFDDGSSTYFAFAPGVDYPAIFVRDAGRKEALVNISPRMGFVVVDQLAPVFVLRRDKEVTIIINERYVEPGPGPLSPKALKRR